MAHPEELQALHATGLFTGVEDGFVVALAEGARLVNVAAGEVVIGQGDPSTSMFVVERGDFDVIMQAEHGEHEPTTIDQVSSGDLIGEAQLITGGTRTATVRARTKGRLLELDKQTFDDLVAGHPEVLGGVIELIHERLLNQQLTRALARALGPAGSELARSIVRDPKWVRLRRGEVLMEAGEPGDRAYLVVSGELLILSPQAQGELFGTITTGELVGEFALLVPGVRTATVAAARESWLVPIEHSRFADASRHQPELTAGVVELVVSRMRARGRSQPRRQTIALLPLSPSVPIEQVAGGLQIAMRRLGGCPRLSAADAMTMGVLRPRQLADDSPAWMRLSLWLQTQRRDHPHVLLVGDSEDSGWNRRIIAEADHIVLVADPRRDDGLSVVDRLIPRRSGEEAWEPRVWMIFAHRADTTAPSGTAGWLRRRDVDLHIHVRVGGPQDDLDRAARMIAGRAVGMALSGGAARGFAHVGVYHAWREAGLPIDCLAGTSAGAFLGGLMAMQKSPAELIERVETTFATIAHPFGDVTLPTIALIRGKRIRDLLHQIYGDVHIEDLWLPFSATCTNLSRGTCEPRHHGSLWRALLASGSPPAVAPPVIIDGELYCDGGVTDNLPVSALDPDVCGHRIASLVGPDSTFSVTDATELPSPWSLAWDRLVRKGERTRGIPHIAEIIMRTMTLGDSHRLAQARTQVDVLFEPPMSSFDMFDFSCPLDPIRAGYHYARQQMADHDHVAQIRTLLG